MVPGTRYTFPVITVHLTLNQEVSLMRVSADVFDVAADGILAAASQQVDGPFYCFTADLMCSKALRSSGTVLGTWTHARMTVHLAEHGWLGSHYLSRDLMSI